MAIVTSWRFWWVSTVLGFVPVLSVGGVRPSRPMIPIPHPTTMLLRVPAVHRELGLDAEQATAVAAIAEGAELPLWRLRDLPAQERDRAAGSILDSVRTKIGGALSAGQSDRLDQLVLQSQGVRAVLEPRVTGALKLTDGQIARIRTILDSPAGQTKPADAEREARAVLSLSQQRALTSLAGSRLDLSGVPQVACKAPELEGVTAWINSSSVTLAQLRGKVVVVHYYAFGCINCIRNLPHYNEWFERFGRDDVAIVGIHRPETEAERDVEAVRRKIAEAGIRYPVAVDNESRNWDAWGNRIWPSVYLIDRRGFVRYWWYGELNWQDARGEPWMRDRISQLLAESRE